MRMNALPNAQHLLLVRY